MEFIICDSNKKELRYLPDSMTVDFDVGNSNDVEISAERADGLELGQWIIAPGTEYGARLDIIKESTNSDTVKLCGDSFRGLLEQYIIEPPPGEDYKIVSGEANAVLQTVVGDAFGGLFTVATASSGITINSYQFDRYTDALTGLTKMLKDYGARLNIEIAQGGAGEPFGVELSAVPIQNLTQTVEYSQDSSVSISLEESTSGITHLICLGQGDLAERTVEHLYLQRDGSIGQTQYYKGLEERTAVYDYSSAEDAAALIESGTEHFLGLDLPSKSMELSVADGIDLQIGDIVAVRNYASGLYVAATVTEKIVTVKSGKITTSYKVEGVN